jgi:flagellar FliL protein
MAKKETEIDLIKIDAAKRQTDDPESADKGKPMPEDPKGEGSRIRRFKKVILFGGGGLVLLGGMIGATGYLGYLPVPGHPKVEKSESHEVKLAEMGPTVKLSPLIINLKEESGRSYLKVTIVLEIGKKDWVEEVQSKMSPLIDTAIVTLSEKQLEDLRDPDSKERLKKELMLNMNGHLRPNGIKGIYFDEFLFQ